MRTAHLLPVSPSMHCSGGVYLPGGRGCTWSRGVYLPGEVHLVPGGCTWSSGVYLPGGCTCIKSLFIASESEMFKSQVKKCSTKNRLQGKFSFSIYVNGPWGSMLAKWQPLFLSYHFFNLLHKMKEQENLPGIQIDELTVSKYGFTRHFAQLNWRKFNRQCFVCL